jgi:hypothetical protein
MFSGAAEGALESSCNAVVTGFVVAGKRGKREKKEKRKSGAQKESTATGLKRNRESAK